MNVVCLTGRLTKDPEIRYTQSQKPVAVFALAVERGYKDENGDRPADFVNCVAWNNSATFLERYAKKGAKLGVTGSIQTRKYQGKDGSNKYATEVNCDKVEIVAFAQRESGDAEPKSKREPASARKQETAPGSGYEVFTPPGFDEEIDDGGTLPF